MKRPKDSKGNNNFTYVALKVAEITDALPCFKKHWHAEPLHFQTTDLAMAVILKAVKHAFFSTL